MTKYNLDDFDYWFNGNFKFNEFDFEETDFGCRAIVRTVGVDEVNVERKGNYFIVTGENEISGKKFSINKRLFVDDDILGKITKVEYTTKCGITIINFHYSSKVNSFNINKI